LVYLQWSENSLFHMRSVLLGLAWEGEKRCFFQESVIQAKIISDYPEYKRKSLLPHTRCSLAIGKIILCPEIIGFDWRHINHRVYQSFRFNLSSRDSLYAFIHTYVSQVTGIGRIDLNYSRINQSINMCINFILLSFKLEQPGEFIH